MNYRSSVLQRVLARLRSVKLVGIAICARSCYVRLFSASESARLDVSRKECYTQDAEEELECKHNGEKSKHHSILKQ